MAEKISVIVPAYNGAPWLARCLDSLLAQTCEEIEIVAVNDGSTDDTGAVLDACAQKDSRIKAIHKENGGVTSARLRGLAEATGDWIGFVDGDDIVEPWMYARLLENARAYNADISHCGQTVVFPDGRTSVVCDDGSVREQDHLTALRDLLDGGLIESGLCTKLYQRELFEGLDAWMDRSVKNNEDLLMNFFLFQKAEKAVFQGVCPYHYILREGSASYRRSPVLKILSDQIQVRKMILAACGPELKQDARQALLRNALFLYGWLVMFPQREYDEGRRLVRGLLQENKAYFGILSRRNKILANLICSAPWLFSLAYRAYVRIRGQEEH